MGVHDLRVNKMERRENKSNLNGKCYHYGKEGHIKNTAMILLKNRNWEGM